MASNFPSAASNDLEFGRYGMDEFVDRKLICSVTRSLASPAAE